MKVLKGKRERKIDKELLKSAMSENRVVVQLYTNGYLLHVE